MINIQLLIIKWLKVFKKYFTNLCIFLPEFDFFI